MKRVILNVALALILSACVTAAIEDPLATPTPTPTPEHWSKAVAGLDDLASVLAVADEAEDVAPYTVLVKEFAECMASGLSEEQERLYADLSQSEMVAMTIWASGLMGAFAAFDFGGSGIDTSYSYIEGAVEICQQSNE